MTQIIYFKIFCKGENEQKIKETFGTLLTKANDYAITNVDPGIPGITRNYVESLNPHSIIINWQCEIQGSFFDLQRFVGCWERAEKEIGIDESIKITLTIGELSF